MAKEILFKAKRMDNGEWIEGCFYQTMEDKNPYIMPIDGKEEKFEVDPATICMYTGLTTRSGKKVWENDIIHYNANSEAYAPIRFGTYRSPVDNPDTKHQGFYVDWQNTERYTMRKDLGYWINIANASITGNVFDENSPLCVY